MASLDTLWLSLPLALSLIALSFYALTRCLKWCDCEICRTYVSLAWSKQFVNLCDWYSHLLNNSPTKTIHIHVLGNTITANPKNVEYMLKTRFENFPKGKSFSAILGDFLGNGIFNVDGELWRFQREMARLELNRRSVRSFAMEVVETEIKNRLVPLLSSFTGQTLDLQEVFRRFAFNNICRFSFGLDPMCLGNFPVQLSEFAAAFDLASRLSAERAMTSSPMVWKVKRFLNVGSEKRLREAIHTIDSLAMEVIKQKRRKLGLEKQKDLLSRFLESVARDDTFLRDIVVSFLLAGRDTVASALTSFFWLMACHPEAESKVRAEADRVLGPSKGLTSFEQMKELHYLQAAIFESMRLYPPVQFDSKFCLNDDVLPDGTSVKSGTRVTYHPYTMARVEEIWGPDCTEFKPERWLSQTNTVSPVNSYKYPVFQAGFRVCLGKEMAMVELKSVALDLLRRFRFELLAPAPAPRFSPGLTASFSGGLPVIVRERDHCF